MKDSDLDQILKTAEVPAREDRYWEEFPKLVIARLQHVAQVSKPAVSPTSKSAALRKILGPTSGRALPYLETRATTPRYLPTFGIGLAAACVVIGLAFVFWKQQPTMAREPQLAEVQKYYREIEALFPNQVRAIVFDQQGPHLVLAEKPNVPASQPLYLKICSPSGCERFVTFSGQQVRVHGQLFDVLVDRRGEVILAGQALVWSSGQRSAKSGDYRIEVMQLTTSS